MKRHTGLLFSSAVVIGLLGGTGAGFLIQQARPATPLPPIQRTLALATSPGTPDPNDPETDDGAKLDGDLRTLLVAKPAGTKDWAVAPDAEWFTIAELAEYYGKPADALVKLNSMGFRRAARTGWTSSDGTQVEVDLVQFRSTQGASSYFAMTGFPDGELAVSVPGTASGYVGRYVNKDDSGMYTAYGLVRHGDVVVQVFMNRKTDVPTTDEVMKVTRDQAGLL